MEKGWKDRSRLSRCCREAGFVHVALDCDGYRRGAMNESLSVHNHTRSV
jgi:PP-loop superfamily ATP-utilizing enzyme